MNQREIQKQKTEKLILETATYLFSRNGFQRVKTIDIAKEAKVSHGTVFSRFKSRDHLIIEVLNYFYEVIMTNIKKKAPEQNTLRDVLSAHIQCLQEYEDFYTYIIAEQTLLPVEASNILLSIHSSISEQIRIVALKEEKEGRIKKIEQHLFFNSWNSLIFYYLLNKRLFSPDKSLLETYGETLVSHFINLITI